MGSMGEGRGELATHRGPVTDVPRSAAQVATLRWLAAGARARRYRNRLLILTDLAAWAAALATATVGRYDFSWREVDSRGLAIIVVIASVLQLVMGLFTGLYLGRFRVASFEEFAAIGATAVFTAVSLTLADVAGPDPRWVPISAPTMAGALAVIAMAATRYVWRSLMERWRRPQGDDLHRVVVFGAGEGGQQVVHAMLRDPDSPYLPVALLDDDPALRRRRLSGVAVAGGRASIALIARTHAADTLVIAIPSASAEVVRDLVARGAVAGVEVKIVPPVRELFGPVGVADIREVTEADLLGRHEITTDLRAIARYLGGKRVLVTGAGGSIGSELCRQIAGFGPENLIMVDRDESALHAVQLSIEGRAMLDSPDVVLLDLRDRFGLGRLVLQRRPHVIFHAAALKHLPLLERHPGEAVKSNVWVTANLLAAARDAGVDRFVNISTDKAAEPTSVLGYSKRIAERLTAHFASDSPGTYLSVRFGNVLGSRGSVLRAFRAQIEAGGPVTVTDPGVTRYFMTVEEAVQLVIQAALIGRDGEALVLDMGAPVRIDEVARRLIEQTGRDIEIEYTGLRGGEKLHESLLNEGEVDERPVHPLISHVAVPPLEPGLVQLLDPTLDPNDVVAHLRALCVRSVTRTSVQRAPEPGSATASKVRG